MSRYDLCIIGSGPAGTRAAIQAAKLGKRACIVERKTVVGGAGVNTGTIPSKALREAILRAGGRVSATPLVQDFLEARNATFRAIQAAADRVIEAEIRILQQQLASNGVSVITGHARFTDPHTVEVAGPTGSQRLAADHFLIAVGTVPARPANIPFDESNVVTSDELVRLPFLPHSMLVVGGGVIGVEYASMLSALGVKVTLIEGRSRLLDFADGEIIEALQYHLRQNGLTLRLGEKVVSVRTIEAPPGARSADRVMVEAVLESGKTLRADCLLYAVGRQGATDDLGLEHAGLKPDNRGRIAVDEHYRTPVPHIYACGDVIGFPALASTSMEQGRLAVCQMFGERCEVVSGHLPYGIYAIPEISMVGWTEESLTEQEIPYEAGVAQYREIARGQLLGDEIGMLKMLIHQDSRAVLGVHIIGTGATELVHIGQCAMAFNATADYFVNAVFNYPTLAECYKVAAHNGINKLRGV
ncbi:MAG: Si-specific NAD(P)(+) transhydrogenase [Phycisphaeraceae bacterium]|nr:Si-specific NAD(P)(+) transhydrogenase [Phycisphaeraceae bacterium]